MNQHLTIKNDTLLEEFLQHLQIIENNDIILSAPFGTGKTHFLKEDFTPKTLGQYNVIHLFPVNYSVSSNEDIFELIKYDILFEIMLKFGDQLTKAEDFQIGQSLAIQMYLQNEFKAVDFFLHMLKTSGKIGKSVAKFIDLLKQEKGRFEEFSKQLEANEYDVIKDYLESFEKDAGTKEFDTISTLISNILVRIKGDSKQNILIIDDLDRIDPEHIFRIFNVLSAHRDYHTQKNKFGFDKVILVCDIENIRRIYQHRYGYHVDFQGYINKFYSKTVFQFDNIRFIKDELEKYLETLEYANFDYSFKKFNLATNNGDGFYSVVKAFLLIFLSHNMISLRGLKNITDVKIRNRIFAQVQHRGDALESLNYDFLVLIEYLAIFLGNRANLIEATRKIENRGHFASEMHGLGIDLKYYQMIMRSLLEMTINIDRLEDIADLDEGTYEYTVPKSEAIVLYKVSVNGYYKFAFVNPNQNWKKISDELDMLKIFKHALDIVERKRYV